MLDSFELHTINMISDTACLTSTKSYTLMLEEEIHLRGTFEKFVD
jgi:hypothetical protein